MSRVDQMLDACLEHTVRGGLVSHLEGRVAFS